jgi:hypothetical protein
VVEPGRATGSTLQPSSAFQLLTSGSTVSFLEFNFEW